jgi:lysophospholipase L1-like esterase
MSPNDWLRLTVLAFLGLCISCQSPPEAATAPAGPVPKSEPAKQKPLHTHKFSYLALGDSYTIGEKVAPDQNYPSQLSKGLREKGIDIDDPEIIAATGWTTANLQRAISATPPALGKYDLVTLLIGVNNQFQGLPMPIFIKEFGTLLKEGVGFAGGKASKVVVISIPDWGVTPFAKSRSPEQIGQQIDEYNRQSKAMCAAEGIAYVDITPTSKKAADDPTLVAPDGLHPSAAMYSLWIPLIAPAAEKALK